jgi:hypothetical protein
MLLSRDSKNRKKSIFRWGGKVNNPELVRAIADWQRAPKDGSLINVEFSGGEVMQARWDLGQERWRFPCHDGHAPTRRDTPHDWWPAF